MPQEAKAIMVTRVFSSSRRCCILLAFAVLLLFAPVLVISAATTNDDGEQDCPATTTSDDDKYERFEHWLKQNGAEFEEWVELRHDNEGMRGIYAKTDISPGTICITIPRKLWITPEMGRATPIGQRIERRRENGFPLKDADHLYIAIFILWDKKRNGNKAFFDPFYQVLPQSLSNIPLFWSQNELTYLTGSLVLPRLVWLRNSYTQGYNDLCEAVPEFGEIASLSEYLWARMIVNSRDFDGDKFVAIVPYADMLNHHFPLGRHNYLFDDKLENLHIRTEALKLAAGEEINIFYGNKMHHDYFLMYGFAMGNKLPEGLISSEALLSLDLLPEDPMYERKMNYWADPGEKPSATKQGIVSVVDDGKARHLWSLLRVLVSNESEFRAILRSGFSVHKIQNPIGLRNEQEAAKKLMSATTAALAKFPTTLEQDEADLLDEASFPNYSNKRNAKILVCEEKKVLKFFEKWATTALQVMDVIFLESVNASESKDFESVVRELRDDATTHDKIVEYCSNKLRTLREKVLTPD